MNGKVTILHASDAEHPNKAHFEGILTYFDAPSDNPVGGAGGRLVYIPYDVGVKALHTLEGMAVNMRRSDLSGHAAQTKVGVIEKAWTGDRLADGSVPVYVAGYLYAKDFANEVDDLRAEKDDLGFSYETDGTTGHDMEGALRPTFYVTDVGAFTGAAILYKKKAAYTKTSFAAESEGDMNEEELRKALEAMGLGDIEQMLTMFKDIQKALGDKGVYTWMNMTLSAEAQISDLTAKVETLEGALTAAGEKVEALTSELAQAKKALTAQASQLNAASAEYVAKSDYDTLKASYDDLSARFTKVETDLAAEAAGRAAYERKSVPVTLTAKYGVGDELDFNAAVDLINQSQALDTNTKFALIHELRTKHLKNAQ